MKLARIISSDYSSVGRWRCQQHIWYFYESGRRGPPRWYINVIWQEQEGKKGKLLRFLSESGLSQPFPSRKAAVSALEATLKEAPEEIKELLASA